MPKVQRSPPQTPSLLSQSACSSDDNMNVTIRNKNRFSVLNTDNIMTESEADSVNMCKTIQQTLRSMFADFEARQEARLDAIERKVSLIKSQNDSIKSTNDDIEKSIMDVSSRIESVQNSIVRLEDDRKKLSLEINQINDKCEAMEKNLLKTCVEIRNVPKVKNETKADLFGYLQHLFGTLKIDIRMEYFRDIYRIYNKKENATSSIVMEFANTFFKANILAASKLHYNTLKNDPLTAKNLGMKNNETRIFISEHLTSKGRHLLYLSRTLKTDKGYSYCWTAGGNVYLRKSDGEPTILVKSVDQLTKLRNEP